MDELREILPFLAKDARLDLKVATLQTVLGLTGSPQGIDVISSLPEMINLLFFLLDDKCNSVAKDSSLALINLSSDRDIVKKWVKLADHLIFDKLWKRITCKDEQVADIQQQDPTRPDASIVVDPCCMILSNLTIDPENCDYVWSSLSKTGAKVSDLISLLCIRNPKGPYRHYLSTALSNLSQLQCIRDELLLRTDPLITSLFIFTEHTDIKRRGGVIGTIRNCTFDTSYHKWLLESIDILPRVLLPLAGPTPDGLDDDDIDKMPIELQYLGEDKIVEPDPDIRKLLLESLLQLCATKYGREYFRNKNAYFILRELHKNEEDKVVRLACENVIDILIKREDEINLDNYHEHEIPDEIVPKLEEMDREYLKEDENIS